jgi:uncharacterized cupredoxin-like copper-binding protein
MFRRIGLILGIVVAVTVAVMLAGAGAAAKDAATPQKVTVLMYDFRFQLKKTLAPGKTTFTVINRGKSIHDFDILRVKNMPFIAPGKRFTYTVTLKKGKWRFICTVPRHAAFGMNGNLVVK